MRSEAELNKLIAEWCGFKPAKCYIPNHMIHPGIGCLPIPDFTHSLDALFKWAVPKLPKWSTVSLSRPMAVPSFYAHITGSYFDSPSMVGTAETAALALARAIEKLIDGEKGESNV